LLERARRAHSPAFLLRSGLHWAALTLGGLLVLLISVFGYVLGGILFMLGVLKVFAFHKTGIYGSFTEHNSSLSFQSGGPIGSHELLGWWLLPVGLLFGGGLLLLTFRFDLWSIRKFWRPRAWQHS
jgi:hypothetical protein